MAAAVLAANRRAATTNANVSSTQSENQGIYLNHNSFSPQDPEFTFLAKIRKPGVKSYSYSLLKQQIKEVTDESGNKKIILIFDNGDYKMKRDIKSYITDQAIFECRKKQAYIYPDSNVIGRFDFQVEGGGPFAVSMDDKREIPLLIKWLEAHNVPNMSDTAIQNPSAEYCNNLVKSGGRRKSNKKSKSNKKK